MSSRLTIICDCVNQGPKQWYLCYHTDKYPVTSFSQFDDTSGLRDSVKLTSPMHPNANSTLIEPALNTEPGTSMGTGITGMDTVHSSDYSYSVGHMSHIPRPPPSPGTYTIPNIEDKTTSVVLEEDLFGLIKLKEHDVCYTSGAIEWVGRKRSFPLNTGFKIMSDNQWNHTEPFEKKSKRLDKTYNCGVHPMKECDCGDVLPTVNAIVDHLNALHEAVDLVDLRLSTLEDTTKYSD